MDLLQVGGQQSRGRRLWTRIKVDWSRWGHRICSCCQISLFGNWLTDLVGSDSDAVAAAEAGRATPFTAHQGLGHRASCKQNGGTKAGEGLLKCDGTFNLTQNRLMGSNQGIWGYTRLGGQHLAASIVHCVFLEGQYSARDLRTSWPTT